MRHRKVGRRLGRDSAQRTLLFRNLITSLVIHGRIRTTEGKGRELVRLADRVVSYGKRALDGGDLVHASRMIRKFVTDRDAISKVTGQYAELYRKDGLTGGHVIALGPGNESAARDALNGQVLCARPPKPSWLNQWTPFHGERG
jgi:large subunit ribosomal protein L17